MSRVREIARDAPARQPWRTGVVVSDAFAARGATGSAQDRRRFPLAAIFNDERVRGIAPVLAICAIGLLTRLRYGVFAYHDTYGSGDAHLILLKALFIRRGETQPAVDVGGVYGDPPLIPLLYAGLSRATGIAIHDLPLIVTPLLTIVALAALYSIVRRSFDVRTALAGVGLVALLPRFSFDSTEPDKVAYVVSFFVIALFLLDEGQRRRPLLALAGVVMGLAAFSHTTAYLFLPVFVLSYVALVAASRTGQAGSPVATREAWIDGWAAAAFVAPLLFIGAHYALDRAYPAGEGAAVTPLASAPVELAGVSGAPITAAPLPQEVGGAPDDWPLVPSTVERELRDFWDLAKGGFRDSAWDIYFDAVSGQIEEPIFVLALAGFAIASATMLLQRAWRIAPLLLWLLIVTLAFALQEPALSHRSRYPSYVTPVFVIMAAYAAMRIGGALARIAARISVSFAEARVSTAIAYAPLALLAAFAAWWYIDAPEPGLRDLYASNRALATYAVERGTLDDGSGVLYVGWPSTTYFLLEPRPEYEDQIYTFGWGAVDIAQFTPRFLAERNIRYFAYDGPERNDYFRTSDSMQRQLERDYQLYPVAFFCDDALVLSRAPDPCAGYMVLYELRPPESARRGD